MAMVSPSLMAMVRNAAFTYPRSGMPKEMLDRPQMVASPFSLQYRMVSSVSTAALLLAPTVDTRPSTMISSFFRPREYARSSTVSMICIFSSKLFGSPSSERGSRMNMAPYFFTIGRSFSNFSASSDTEFTRALPG